MRERPQNLPAHTTSLAESDIGDDEVELSTLLAVSFQKAMGVTLQEDRLTTQELQKSTELRLKYCNDGWNLHGEFP